MTVTKQIGPLRLQHTDRRILLDVPADMFPRVLDAVERAVEPPRVLRQVLAHVTEHGAASARELALVLRISPQNASNRLRALHRDGYVTRTEHAHPAGGTEWVFAARPLDSKE